MALHAFHQDKGQFPAAKIHSGSAGKFAGDQASYVNTPGQSKYKGPEGNFIQSPGKVYNHSKRMKEKRGVLDGVATELRRIIGEPAPTKQPETGLRLVA